MFERLGTTGLIRVLDDLLDHRRIVRLANTCGLRYPGMRTQSQKRDRLLADLADRALNDETARVTIGRTLEKETAAERRRWEKLSEEEKARRIGDEAYLRANGNLGRQLYLLASADGESDTNGFQFLLAQQHLLRIAAENGAAGGGAAKPTRGEARLHKRIAELQKKAQHLESQLSKSREAERIFKRDLIQRKGELAESRMLAERLGRELEQFRAERASTPKSAPPTPAADAVSKINKSLRKLTAEQSKLLRALDKSSQAQAEESRKPRPLRIDPKVLDPLRQDLEALRKELASQRREFKREAQRQTERIEALRTSSLGAVWRASPAGEAERIAVFIDVQNMYYGARRLKGKLDFDALLEAAVGDRRLIRATAYVVESKEIDQSGFIALLEQRAIEVRRKTLQVRADHSKKGDWDMELALDVLDAAPHLDVVVLVSGDGDFTSLVQRVKTIGPRVEVIGFPRTTAKSLVQAADHFEPLGRKFMIYPSRKPGPTRPTVAAKPSGGEARDGGDAA